jgi:predicted aspartyl protease
MVQPSVKKGTVMSAIAISNVMSRRGVVGCGTAALMLSSAWGQAISTAAVPDAASAIAAHSDDDRHLTIPVTINGKGPFRFVVDTGADRSVLSDWLATELGLVPKTKIMVEGVVRTVTAETVHIDEIAFGVVRRENLLLPILPRTWLGADGFLGLDMIDRYRVTFDFKGHQLLIEEPRSLWSLGNAFGNEDVVSADGWHGHLRAVNCRIDGVVVTVFIDTGAEISIANQALFDELIERDPKYFIKANTTQIDGVTGGSLIGRVIDFNRIKIKNMSFTNGSIVVADLQVFALWGLADRPAILIGMNFLRQFDRVSIDYRRKQFDFDLSCADQLYAQNPPARA